MNLRPSHPESGLPSLIKEALQEGNCIQMVLSKPIKKKAAARRKVSIRPVLIRDKQHYQLSFTRGQQEVHENLLPGETIQRVEQLWEDLFLEGYLFTNEADYHLQKTKQGSVQLKKHAPTKAQPEQPKSHNRAKQYLIPEGVHCPFLEEIGVMSRNGKVKAAQYRKFRQINRYLEFINDIVSALPKDGTLQITDFGCGKSYLTFATHHFFTSILQRDVNITGLDLKRSVVEHCQQIAENLDCRGLSFKTGDIAAFQDEQGHCDLSISLHACDTATDAALAAAIQADANVILAVPCCQNEIYQQITSQSAEGLLKHGILKEKTAALLTDALRSQVLEISGYRTQVIEFIDTQHTPKNLLIKAVKRATPLTDSDLQQAVQEYESLKTQFGIPAFALERSLGDQFKQLCESAVKDSAG